MYVFASRLAEPELSLPGKDFFRVEDGDAFNRSGQQLQGRSDFPFAPLGFLVRRDIKIAEWVVKFTTTYQNTVGTDLFRHGRQGGYAYGRNAATFNFF